MKIILIILKYTLIALLYILTIVCLGLLVGAFYLLANTQGFFEGSLAAKEAVIYMGIGFLFFILVILFLSLSVLKGRVKWVQDDTSAPSELEEIERNETRIILDKFWLFISGIFFLIGSFIFLKNLFEIDFFMMGIGSCLIINGFLLRSSIKLMSNDIEPLSIKTTAPKSIKTDDPIADQIKWTPVRLEASGKTIVKEIGINKIKIKPSKSVFVFVGIFVVFGSFFLLDGLFEVNISMILVGFCVLVGALIVSSDDFKEIHIDKTENLIYEKKKFIFEKINSSPPLLECISNVHALQITSKYIKGGRGSSHSGYLCFEINLIFKDLRRACIMNHKDRLGLIEDAKKISTFLNIPIWDAT
jgi:hypothetical protein